MILNFSDYLSVILILYFCIASLYLLFFAISGKIKKIDTVSISLNKRKYAVIIPAYKEDEVIEDIVDDALTQDYSSELFDIIVIADDFLSKTLVRLRQKPITLIEVKFKDSTKTKALQEAINSINQNYEVGLILDADNLMEPNLLEKLNFYFDKGCRVVQAHRVAKNLDTSYSILDGASEEINNTIFRKGHRNIGLSSALIGSGMAFEYNLLKELLVDAKAVGGFDKELEFKLMHKRIKIDYAEQAYIYDEKVQKANAFANQRKRWIIAQLEHLARNILPGLLSFFKHGNVDYLNKVIQMALPPRSLLVVFVPLLIVINWALLVYNSNQVYLIFTLSWLIISLLTAMAFVIALPKKYYCKSTLLAILRIPYAVLKLSHTLLSIRDVRKKFIHTKHYIKQTKNV